MQARRAQQAQQQEQAAEAEQAAQNRRAAAYDQVGSLIAQGKCTEARQLAQFYNKPDIIADTNRVCPEPPPPQQASAAAPPKVDADAPKITAMVAQGKCHEAETYAGVIRRPDLVAVAKLCKNP